MGLSTTVQKIMDRQSKCCALRKLKMEEVFRSHEFVLWSSKLSCNRRWSSNSVFSVRSISSCTTCLDIVAAAQEKLSDTSERVRFHKQGVLIGVWSSF